MLRQDIEVGLLSGVDVREQQIHKAVDLVELFLRYRVIILFREKGFVLMEVDFPLLPKLLVT